MCCAERYRGARCSVEVLADPRFSREGDNISLEVPISIKGNWVGLIVPALLPGLMRSILLAPRSSAAN